MNCCCKARLLPKTAALNSSFVVSKAPKSDTHAEAEGRGGLPGSIHCFTFTLEIGSRIGGEEHVFPAHHIRGHYLASLCEGEREPAIQELSISRSAALCRQFLALESQDMGTRDINIMKHITKPLQHSRRHPQDSSLSISNVTERQNRLLSS